MTTWYHSLFKIDYGMRIWRKMYLTMSQDNLLRNDLYHKSSRHQ